MGWSENKQLLCNHPFSSAQSDFARYKLGIPHMLTSAARNQDPPRHRAVRHPASSVLEAPISPTAPCRESKSRSAGSYGPLTHMLSTCRARIRQACAAAAGIAFGQPHKSGLDIRPCRARPVSPRRPRLGCRRLQRCTPRLLRRRPSRRLGLVSGHNVVQAIAAVLCGREAVAADAALARELTLQQRHCVCWA